MNFIVEDCQPPKKNPVDEGGSFTNSRTCKWEFLKDLKVRTVCNPSWKEVPEPLNKKSALTLEKLINVLKRLQQKPYSPEGNNLGTISPIRPTRPRS